MRRTGVVLFAVLAMVAGACSNGADTNERVAAVALKLPPSTSTSTTATTAAASPPAARATASSPALAVAGARIQRVRTLPASEDTSPPAKSSAPGGPTPKGRITIPRIGLSHLTYEGIDLATIDHGPSHWPGTALPGQVGNTVFAGHRVTHDHPFFDIDLIRIGDNVVFSNDSGRYTYQVTDTFVVNADQTEIADPTDTPTMTIFGCHPKHSAKQRYVVKGKLVKSERTPGGSGGSGDGGYGNYPAAPDPSEPTPTTTTTTAPPNGVRLPHVGG